MKRSPNHLRLFILCVAFALAIVLPLKAEAVNVDIYSGHGTAGGGAPYSGLTGSFTSPDILFATNTGYAWHPFGLGDFGAEITGFLQVATGGTYNFTLNSDDGSLLYIDSTIVVNNGGPHSPGAASGSAILAAGLYPFKVEFYEDFGGPSGVDLYLPEGVIYGTPVPEPFTLALLGLGLLGIAGIRRKVE